MLVLLSMSEFSVLRKNLEAGLVKNTSTFSALVFHKLRLCFWDQVLPSVELSIERSFKTIH